MDVLGVPYFESVRGPGYGSMADDKVRAIVGFGKPVMFGRCTAEAPTNTTRAWACAGL